MLTDGEMLARMAGGWPGGLPFTACGNGSLPASTANIRAALPQWATKYQLRTVNDAGAGDLRWRDGMIWDVVYRAFDLVPRVDGVICHDITAAELPPCDLILCRMVLNHLDDQRIDAAIRLFRKSSRYLAATHFENPEFPDISPQFRRVDLRQRLGEPLEMVQDGNEGQCRLALWKL